MISDSRLCSASHFNSMLEVNSEALTEPNVLASVPQLLLIRIHGGSLQLTRILLWKQKENQSWKRKWKQNRKKNGEIIPRGICFNFYSEEIESEYDEFYFLKSCINNNSKSQCCKTIFQQIYFFYSEQYKMDIYDMTVIVRTISPRVTLMFGAQSI